MIAFYSLPFIDRIVGEVPCMRTCLLIIFHMVVIKLGLVWIKPRKSLTYGCKVSCYKRAINSSVIL